MLFICSGNYYRSRFAEILFNTLAAERELDWQASSRGLADEFGAHNVGPISPFTLQRLASLGIAPSGPVRMPLHLLEEDLEDADWIVALNEPEHRPLLERRLTRQPVQVEYWHIPDLNRMGADEALAAIEAEVRALVERLAAQRGERY